MSYPEKIAAHLSTIEQAVLNKKKAESEEWGEIIHIPIDRLVADLGCRAVIPGVAGISEPPQPEPRYEAIVTNALVVAIRTCITIHGDNNDIDSVIDGLIKNNRWRSCLNTADDAYHLVETLVTFHHNRGLYAGMHTLQASLSNDVRNVISQWLGGRLIPLEMTPIETARLFFGDAWCYLSLEYDSKHSIIALIRRERPPFMPGLLPAHLEPKSLLLPGLSI